MVGAETGAERAETAADRISDRVARAVLDMIARGDVAPGDRLPGERRLAAEMGVSRVSIRAALQRLKTQGLLSAVQGGGTRVVSSACEMDPALTAIVRANADNLRDLAEIRLVLETWAARRAALHATEAQTAEIRRRLEAMADPARARLRGADDAAFHLAVAKAAGSPVYLHFLTMIRDTLEQMLRFHRHRLFPADSDGMLLAQHRAIHDAIAARDPEGAGEAMRRHLGWVLSHYPDAVPPAPDGAVREPVAEAQGRP